VDKYEKDLKEKENDSKHEKEYIKE